MSHPSSGPVAEAGKLVGVVRAGALFGSSDDVTVDEVMEAPVFVRIDDAVEEIAELAQFLEGAEVPVVDRGGVLLGAVAPDSLY